MTSVFNKIHRLKRQPGWTWDRFLGEIDQLSISGMDEKTLYSHFRQPHKKPNSHTKDLIDQLHDHYFPNPFPEDINRLMRLYNSIAQTRTHANRERDIEDLESFLVESLRRERREEHLRRARLNWLLGNISFDRLPVYRDNGQRQRLDSSKAEAINYYQNSVGCIEDYNRENPAPRVGASHLYKSRHNILACYLNAVPQDQRETDAEILGYLMKSDYISRSKETLVEEPFQWSIARNGLRFSSLVENPDDIKYFFSCLVTVNDKFADLTYEPLNYGAIASSRDFSWALENVLTSEYLDQFNQ